MKVGAKLKMLRKLKGYTQEEVAEKLNIERRTYANLENNFTKMDIDRTKQIAKMYGIELNELMSFNEDEAFANCFNNNGFFSAEKVYSGSTKEERKYFVEQMQTLVSSFNEERKMFMEIIVNLKKVIDKTK